MKGNIIKNQSKWFVNYTNNNYAVTRLFCFPPAGGSASYFRTWKNKLTTKSNLFAIQLPGREKRTSESFFMNIEEIVDSIHKDILIYLDKPYVFFGHSLGALISFEVVRRLAYNKLPQPKFLILSGRAAPHLKLENIDKISCLKDESFINKIDSFGGIPQELKANKDFLELILPRLRADFRIAETYNYQNALPIESDIIRLCGEQDKYVVKSNIDEWGKHTTGKLFKYMFPGGHFFINSFSSDIVNIVNEALGKSVIEYN